MPAWIISSGVSVVSVLLIRRIFKGKIRLRLQYALWLLVLVRLLIPVNIIDTDLSILNFLTQAQAVGGISDLGGAAGGSAHSSQDAFMQNLLKRGTMGGISETMPYERLAEGETGQQSDESLIWSEKALLGRDISSLRPDIPEVQDEEAAGMGLWEKILIGIWIVSMICQCSWSMLSDDVLPTAVLDYVMERQADGSWRMVEDYELPVSLTLKEDSKYGLYMTMVGEVPCLLNLDRDGTFSFYEAISSILTDSMRGVLNGLMKCWN